MKVEQRKARLKAEDIYGLAHKEISRRGKLSSASIKETRRRCPTVIAIPIIKPRLMRLMRMLRRTLTPPNPLTPPSKLWVTLNLRRRKPSTPGLNRHLHFGFRVPNIGNNVNKRIWTTILIGVSPIATFGRVSLVLHAMTPIGLFRASLKVVSLGVVVVATRVAVAVRLVVAIRVVAARAIKEGKERRTGADVDRSAQSSPLRRKKPSDTPLTLRWLSFRRES